MDQITNKLNALFKNDEFRTFIFIITSIWLGYTLQPVPDWLNQVFDTSNIVKFLIIFAVGATSFYPLDNREVRNLFVGTIVVMFIFHLMRQKGDLLYAKESLN
jgi:hypothetical protein